MNIEKDNRLTVGSGAPVVMLHSALSSKLQWYHLIQTMKKNHLMIALDLYGYGDTPFPENPENHSLHTEVALVCSLLENIVPPDRPVHLVGHSLGAAVALLFAYLYKDRVRSLCLYEPVCFHALPETEAAKSLARDMGEKLTSFVSQGKYASAAEYFVDYWNGKGTLSSYPREMREMIVSGVKKLPLDFRGLLGEPLRGEDYARIEAPTCIIAGSQSPVDSRGVAEYMANMLPDCRLKWVNGGHMAPIYQVSQVNTIIQSFLAAQGPYS